MSGDAVWMDSNSKQAYGSCIVAGTTEIPFVNMCHTRSI